MNKRHSQCDIVVVGAGLTALGFAAQMAIRRPEVRITVVEKHHRSGGYASEFYRRSTRFDCSLHKLSGLRNGGNMERVFQDLGLTDELEFTDSDALFHTVVGGTVLPTSRRDAAGVRAGLLAHFPGETAGLDHFFREIEVHGRNGYFYFRIFTGDFRPAVQDLRYARRHLAGLSVEEALRERFSDPLLREIAGASCTYVGAFPEDLSYLYYLHLLYATLQCGNVYLRGGSQALSNALVRRIEAAGGEVRLRTEVKRILIDGEGCAYGVETKAGAVYADQVYVNASPHYALERLLPDLPKMESAAWLAEMTPSFSTTTLYVEADGAPAEFGAPAVECMLLDDRFETAVDARRAARSAPADAALSEDAYWRRSPAMVTDYHRLDPTGGRVLCVNVLDTIDHWPDRKTAEYREKKERAKYMLLARLFKAFPALQGHVKWAEVATPHTYQRYTFNHRGAGYGAIATPGRRPPHVGLPVRNLKFLSAWVAGPTYEAALGYGEMEATNYRPTEHQFNGVAKTPARA